MRKVLANLLFIFLGLPLALSALMLISVRPWALDRDAYKRFVEDDRLYAALQAPDRESRSRDDQARTGFLRRKSLASAAQKRPALARDKVDRFARRGYGPGRGLKRCPGKPRGARPASAQGGSQG